MQEGADFICFCYLYFLLLKFFAEFFALIFETSTELKTQVGSELGWGKMSTELIQPNKSLLILDQEHF